MQELIDAQLKAQGIEKGKMEGYSYLYTKSTKTIVTDESQLPGECWVQKVDLNKVKQYLQGQPDGIEIPGAHLLETRALKIKPIEEKE